MQNPNKPGFVGINWSQQFPDYSERMEQINKMFRVLESLGGLYLLTENLTLVPKV